MLQILSSEHCLALYPSRSNCLERIYCIEVIRIIRITHHTGKYLITGTAVVNPETQLHILQITIQFRQCDRRTVRGVRIHIQAVTGFAFTARIVVIRRGQIRIDTRRSRPSRLVPTSRNRVRTGIILALEIVLVRQTHHLRTIGLERSTDPFALIC